MSPLRTPGSAVSLQTPGTQARAEKRRFRKRLFIAVIGGLWVGALGQSAVFKAPILFVWNSSASAPLGLYQVFPDREARVGDTVIARMPQAWREFAAARRYLPSNVPLVKRVAASEGQEVCALGSRIFIDGVPVAERKLRDGQGRPLPWWEGCGRLSHGQFFLLMAKNPDSFDGRYFGVTGSADILGPARLVWAR